MVTIIIVVIVFVIAISLPVFEKMRFGEKCVSGKTSLGRNANLTNLKFFRGLRFGLSVGRNAFFPKTGLVNLSFYPDLYQ
jgi:hypothetical protein